MRFGYIVNLWLTHYVIYELIPFPESVKFSVRRCYLCWYFASKFPRSRAILRPRQNFAGAKKIKYSCVYTRIFPVPKFHKTSYSLYGLCCTNTRLEGNGYKSLLSGTLFRNHTEVPFFTGRGVSDHKMHTWSVAVYQTVGAAVNRRRMETTTPLIFWSVCEIHDHYMAVLLCI